MDNFDVDNNIPIMTVVTRVKKRVSKGIILIKAMIGNEISKLELPTLDEYISS